MLATASTFPPSLAPYPVPRCLPAEVPADRIGGPAVTLRHPSAAEWALLDELMRLAESGSASIAVFDLAIDTLVVAVHGLPAIKTATGERDATPADLTRLMTPQELIAFVMNARGWLAACERQEIALRL